MTASGNLGTLQIKRFDKVLCLADSLNDCEVVLLQNLLSFCLCQ